MPRRMDRSEGERRTAQRSGDQSEAEGSRREERGQSERDNKEAKKRPPSMWRGALLQPFSGWLTTTLSRFIRWRSRAKLGMPPAAQACLASSSA